MPIKVKQRDITDCGAACICSVASHYKLNLTVSGIRQLASTDQKGTTVQGLMDALDKLGFQSKGVRGELKSLLKIPKPAIAHIIVKEVLHHFVVIYRVTPAFVQIMDPADGQLHRVTQEEFKKRWSGILVILQPGEKFQPGNNTLSIASRFWTLMKSHQTTMVQAIVGALIYTLIGLTTSIYVQKIIDYVLVDGNRNLLNLMSLGMIFFLVFQVFISYQKNLLTLRTGQSIDIRLILGYYNHLLKLPQRFFDSMRVGEIISRVNDAVKIRAFINEALAAVVVNIFVVISSFALMFTYYWKLALIILLVIPFYGVIYFITNRLNKKVERTLMENSAGLETELVESLNSVRTIKGFGLEEFANTRMEIHFIRLMKTVYISGKNAIYTATSSEFISKLFTIILLWTGAGFVLDTSITPGELLSFYALIAYFTGPVSSLIGINKTVQSALISADRLFEIMDLEHVVEENLISVLPATGTITFRNVNFRYGSRGNVFTDLNLEIPEGKITAIVGESGSGKSSLIAILQKHYPIQSGNIFIGEHDLKYISLDSLRNLISVVPQKIDLFAGNVAENIAIGEYQPDVNRIISLCQTLGMLAFIEKLPQGFNTWLGENGALLSGGQKQWIAIARALYKNHTILILDEATSSLDTSSEKYIHHMTRRLLKQNKTVIVIAHRLSSVVHADKIIVLQEGKVVEEGNHAALLELSGAYGKLWRDQFPVIAEKQDD
jgi:ABC-type bacteriocin transporter